MAFTYRDIPTLTAQQITNFWNKVDKSPGHGPNGDCWIWTGGKDRNGYGHFNLKLQRRQAQAHRVAYALCHTDFDPSLNVCHSCDFGHGGCVRPDHLWQGSTADNHRDMQNKGRDANVRGERHWTKRHPENMVKGEQVCTAKLTEAQVREIIALADSGVSHADLAKQYSMSRAAISLIAERKRWKHVT